MNTIFTHLLASLCIFTALSAQADESQRMHPPRYGDENNFRNPAPPPPTRPDTNWTDREIAITQVVNLEQNGQYRSINVNEILNLNYQYRGKIVKKIIVLASTQAGHGQLSLNSNGRVERTETVDQSVAAYTFEVGERLMPRWNTLFLETRGRFFIHSITAVLDNTQVEIRAQGYANQMPFNFQAFEREQIYTQCIDFFYNQTNRRMMRIRFLSVNGAEFRPQSFYSVEQACNIVKTNAN